MTELPANAGQPVEKGTRVAGKVALASGSRSSAAGIGNGRASAILQARHGARIALRDVNLVATEETPEMIRAEGGECFALAGDVSQDAVARFDRPDIVVNVVATSPIRGGAETVDLHERDCGMTLNIKSIVMTARHAMPHMRKNGVRVKNVTPGFVHTPVVYGKGIPDIVREYRRRAGITLPVDADASAISQHFQITTANREINAFPYPGFAGNKLEVSSAKCVCAGFAFRSPWFQMRAADPCQH